jgi:ribosomal protein L20A (L18A)
MRHRIGGVLGYLNMETIDNIVEKEVSQMTSKWKVKFQDSRAREGRRPFFKMYEIVDASTRKEAIEIIVNKWDCYGHYDKYSASKLT